MEANGTLRLLSSLLADIVVDGQATRTLLAARRAVRQLQALRRRKSFAKQFSYPYIPALSPDFLYPNRQQISVEACGSDSIVAIDVRMYLFWSVVMLLNVWNTIVSSRLSIHIAGFYRATQRKSGVKRKENRTYVYHSVMEFRRRTFVSRSLAVKVRN